MNQKMTVRLVAVLTTVLASTTFAVAAEVKVLSTIAFQRVFEEAVPTFNRASGHKASVEFGGGSAMAARAQGGEVADVYFGARSNIDALVKAGKVQADSVVDLARSPVGFAVKKGAAKPKISTADSLKRALLASKGITYPDPASGSPSANHLVRVAQQLGIADELQSKTRRPPGGGAAGPTMLISGEADLAFQQNCELLLTPGVELLEPLPREFQLITVMSAAVLVTAREPEAAKAFIRLLQGAEVAKVMSRWGLEPIAASATASTKH